MGLKDKKKSKKNKELSQRNLEPVEKDIKLGPSEMRKRKREKENNGESGKIVQISNEDNSAKAANDKKKTKKLRKGKVKKVKNHHALDDPPNTDGFDELNDDEVEDQSQFEIQGETGNAEIVLNDDDGKSKKARKKKKKDCHSLEGGKSLANGVEAVQGEACHLSSVDEDCSKEIPSKSKKSQKKKRRDMDSSKSKKSLEKKEKSNQDDVYVISSEDEGSPKGMKKWIMEYQQNRPGLKVLQQRIDEFIIAHEAKLEQERKEREERSAEEGWQLVQHHKGRKKSKDAESGITVGSVAQAVVESKRAKKKNTDVGLDFYRFQRKEAQRNEIMMLQSKFEQDKKRIQQIRAARKFKPY